MSVWHLFLILAKAKFIEDRDWTEIADKLNISATTLCSFFYRRHNEKVTNAVKKQLSCVTRVCFTRTSENAHFLLQLSAFSIAFVTT